jgi:hypothetical protein
MDRPLTIFFLSELSVAEQDPSSNRIQAFQARTCALNVLTEPYPHLKEEKNKGGNIVKSGGTKKNLPSSLVIKADCMFLCESTDGKCNERGAEKYKEWDHLNKRKGEERNKESPVGNSKVATINHHAGFPSFPWPGRGNRLFSELTFVTHLRLPSPSILTVPNHFSTPSLSDPAV